mmetsp:Transcript_56680/g.126611  ORF Transcript_56680/g.126611 Transcript_56680/m.126611 type:complete len:201 (+) Transcript_56680:711-1313(+)
MTRRGTSLSARATRTLRYITWVHRRAPMMASGILRRSFVINTTPAASDAIAVPATPIATPTSAAARAGPSLTPSPTIPTTADLLISMILSSLSFGFMAECAVSMPAAARMCCACASQSPVSIITWIPMERRAATAVLVSLRMRSESWHTPATRWSTRTQSTEAPAAFHAATTGESRAKPPEFATQPPTLQQSPPSPWACS